MRPGGSSRPMMAAPVSDLPAPDSPTTPRISPGAMSKEMSSSARSVPRRVGELDDQVLDFEQAHRSAPGQRSRGFSASRSQSPSRFTDSAISDQHDAGEDGDPPLAREQVVVADADQRAQRGRRRRHADAQEGQRRLGDDGGGRRGWWPAPAPGPVTLGSTWRAHDAQRRHAGHARGLHVFLVALHQRGAAHRARVLHPAGERDATRSARRRPRVSCAFGNSARPTPAISSATRIAGKRQHHVAQAHQEGVDPAAREARQQAQRDADHHRQHHRRHAHHQRDARAVHQRREDVAALVVGAQQVLACCRPASRPAAAARRPAPAWSGRTGCAAPPSPANSRAEHADEGDRPPPTIAIGEVRKL